jgi:hypothetical protein
VEISFNTWETVEILSVIFFISWNLSFGVRFAIILRLIIIFEHFRFFVIFEVIEELIIDDGFLSFERDSMISSSSKCVERFGSCWNYWFLNFDGCSNLNFLSG